MTGTTVERSWDGQRGLQYLDPRAVLDDGLCTVVLTTDEGRSSSDRTPLVDGYRTLRSTAGCIEASSVTDLNPVGCQTRRDRVSGRVNDSGHRLHAIREFGRIARRRVDG